jgi:hypothetical protein
MGQGDLIQAKLRFYHMFGISGVLIQAEPRCCLVSQAEINPPVHDFRNWSICKGVWNFTERTLKRKIKSNQVLLSPWTLGMRGSSARQRLVSARGGGAGLDDPLLA